MNTQFIFPTLSKNAEESVGRIEKWKQTSVLRRRQKRRHVFRNKLVTGLSVFVWCRQLSFVSCLCGWKTAVWSGSDVTVYYCNYVLRSVIYISRICVLFKQICCSHCCALCGFSDLSILRHSNCTETHTSLNFSVANLYVRAVLEVTLPSSA